MTTTITVSTSPANRKEIAEAFGQNQSAVRRIESITKDVTVNLPDAIDTTNVIAEQALALAQALQEVAYILSSPSSEVPSASVLAASAGLTLTVAPGTITISLSIPVSVPHGGTGLATLPTHGVPVGNGVAEPNFAMPVSAGYVLTDNGPSADPSFKVLPATVSSILAGTGINVSSATGNVTVSLASPVAVANGGTGAITATGALLNLGGVPSTSVGIAGGVASLDGTGKVPASQLPATTPSGIGALAVANNLSDVASATSARVNLGLGTAAIQNVGSFLQTANNLSDLSNVSTAATNLGLGTGNTPTFTGLNTSGSSATGVTALTLLNASVASGTGKSVGILFQGKDTTGTLKTTAGIVTAPSDSNHVNDGLVFQVRSADALVEAGRISPTKNFLLGYTTEQAGGEKAQINGALAINSTLLVHSYTSFTNGAASAAGTLSNAPVAGNPTKWIPINDNGTIRYLPSW